MGFAAPSEPYRTGGALSVHAAYGVSDMFDARIQLAGSHHERGGREQSSLFRGALGVAYKLDITEWVPYLGVRAGYYRFGKEPAARVNPAESIARSGGLIGTMLGVDYALSRGAAIGVELDYDTLLPHGGTFGATLHGEYRWGF